MPCDPERPIRLHIGGAQVATSFVVVVFCGAVCSEMILRMLQYVDLKLNYALNHHHFCSLLENQSAQGKCRRHTNKETCICLQQLHTVLTFVSELCFEFPQQKMQIIKTPTVEYVLGV